MHLVEQYSLVTGAKINKPFIETSYYPVPFDKYIVVENGGQEVKSRIYSMWTDIVADIKDYLDAENIKIVQVGAADSEQMAGVFDLRGRTTTKQLAYIIKNSLLHCSTNDFLLDVASHFDVPVVGMYGNTYANVAKPYWGNVDKKIIIEALWDIIYSDEDADMYETNLMRRLSGLLYLDPKIVGDIKEKVRQKKI